MENQAGERRILQVAWLVSGFFSYKVSFLPVQ
jgi:hypothetical protein